MKRKRNPEAECNSCKGSGGHWEQTAVYDNLQPGMIGGVYYGRHLIEQTYVLCDKCRGKGTIPIA